MGKTLGEGDRTVCGLRLGAQIQGPMAHCNACKTPSNTTLNLLCDLSPRGLSRDIFPPFTTLTARKRCLGLKSAYGVGQASSCLATITRATEWTVSGTTTAFDTASWTYVLAARPGSCVGVE